MRKQLVQIETDLEERKTKLEKFLKNLGNKDFIKLNYLLSNYFGTAIVTVLCLIIDEYIQANNKNLVVENYFLFDIQKVSEFLTFSKNEIMNILYFLDDDMGLIAYYSTTNIKNTMLVSVEEDELIEFLKYNEKLCSQPTFDWELIDIPESEYDTTFLNPTIKLIDFVKKNTKNPEKIPMVTYALCDLSFNRYNVDLELFMAHLDIQEKISACINYCHFQPYLLVKLIELLCIKMEEKRERGEI